MECRFVHHFASINLNLTFELILDSPIVRRFFDKNDCYTTFKIANVSIRIKFYEEKRNKIREKIFSSAQLLSLRTLFAKGSNPRRRGGGGAGCPALDRASLHLTSEKKRGTKGGGAVGRGTEEEGEPKSSRASNISSSRGQRGRVEEGGREEKAI